MRLLDAWALIYDGVAELVEFADDRSAPPYAILSHTWADEEVLFHDLPLGPSHEIVPSAASLRASRRPNGQADKTERPQPHVKAGWNKILNTCLRALQDDLEYVWIDTCCIDKSSSAELSEAINSMYRWYRKADVCYVHLFDCELCPDLTHPTIPCELETEFETVRKYPKWTNRIDDKQFELENRVDGLTLNQCMRNQLLRARWFTRGWTLQELLAPRKMLFFDKNWLVISEKGRILPTIESITVIHRLALQKRDINWSVAQRMSWASKRTTTRVEDQAYCLLGLFRINMPLIYGEGSKAFLRLQEEIARSSTDQSLLAWEFLPGVKNPDIKHYLFAPSPAYFWWHAQNIETYYADKPHTGSYSDVKMRVGAGMRVKLSLRLDNFRQKYGSGISIAYLDCGIFPRRTLYYEDSPPVGIGLRLQNTSPPDLLEDASVKDRMHTWVQPEWTSTVEEPESTPRRLVYATELYRLKRLCTSRHLLSVSDRRSGQSSSPAVDSYRPRGTTFLNICFEGAKQDQYRWRVVEVYPPNQWNHGEKTMNLPLTDRTIFAGLIIQNQDEARYTILLGTGNIFFRVSAEGCPTNGTYIYWIFSGPPYEYTSHLDSLLDPDRDWMPESAPIGLSDGSISRLQDSIRLQKLCERWSSIASKDSLECTALPWNSHKSLVLPGGDIMRVLVDITSAFPRIEAVSYKVVVVSNDVDDLELSGSNDPFPSK